MDCRSGCGACCIAPSISSPIPGMPYGKPMNTRCVQLSEDNLCLIFGSPLRPKVCSGLQPTGDMCLTTREEAIIYLLELEQKTLPWAMPFLINVQGLTLYPEIVCKSCASNYLLLPLNSVIHASLISWLLKR